MQEHIHKQFRSEDSKDTLNEASVAFPDKRDGKDPKKKRIYWIRTLKTVEPYIYR